MSIKFRHTKSLGQNFLIDNNIVDEIIEGSCIDENDMVIEIGPGFRYLSCTVLFQFRFKPTFFADWRRLKMQKFRDVQDE